MKPNCWMIRRDLNGGGNVLSESSLVVRRTAAIGDALAATVVADRLIKLGFEVSFQSHPACHCVLRRHPGLLSVTEPQGYAHVVLDGAYEHDPGRRRKHFTQMFFEKAQEQLRPRGIELGDPLNCRPRIIVPKADQMAVASQLGRHPRPWVFVCPRSDHYAARQVPDMIWSEAAAKIHGTKFWIGRHPAPPNFIDLVCRHMDNVISYLSVADLLVSVDTGPLHVAAALGVQVLGLGQSSSPDLHLSDQQDFMTIEPAGLTCLNCQLNLCPMNQYLPPCQQFSPHFIAEWANAKLRRLNTETISAVVAIYKPDVQVLNRCLECLENQVDEIIVTAEANSEIPALAMKREKIRYVRKPVAAIGYGRNANFGARHSTGKYILFCNDDVFLDPEAVSRMKECMTPGVGMVTNLLYYPEKTIYYNGKFRSPGQRGWGHGDYRKHLPERTEPLELENACGCCALVRREAFYQIDGFDESEGFKIYAGDDDFALRLRRAGYRIMHNPRSTGIHMEGQSTRKIWDIQQILQHANGHFGSVWGKYLDHNADIFPIGNFNY